MRKPWQTARYAIAGHRRFRNKHFLHRTASFPKREFGAAAGRCTLDGAMTYLTPSAPGRSMGRMLAALTCGFALSQAWRTVAAIMAAPLQADFALNAQALGLFAGAFHFAFGAMQLFMGIGIDLHGVRRTCRVNALPLFPGSRWAWAVSACC